MRSSARPETRKLAKIDGILNILKPSGPTSFAVVSRLRRASGERRAGHAGTLDPAATGVLIVCLGQATRTIEYFAGSRKTYSCCITLGVSTDTYDATGAITEERDPSGITREQAEAALQAYTGTIDQMPPMYSAVKYQGERLYRFARKGMEVPRKARQVQIYRNDLLDWRPPDLEVVVECSAGTYIRSLAYDIGQYLGCGAHLHALVRLRAEPFRIEESIPLQQAEDAFYTDAWKSLLRPMDEPLRHWKSVTIGAEMEGRIRNGQRIHLPDAEPGSDVERRRAYTEAGDFLAVLRHEAGDLWQPEKVFSTSIVH